MCRAVTTLIAVFLLIRFPASGQDVPAASKTQGRCSKSGSDDEVHRGKACFDRSGEVPTEATLTTPGAAESVNAGRLQRRKQTLKEARAPRTGGLNRWLRCPAWRVIGCEAS